MKVAEGALDRTDSHPAGLKRTEGEVTASPVTRDLGEPTSSERITASTASEGALDREGDVTSAGLNPTSSASNAITTGPAVTNNVEATPASTNTGTRELGGQDNSLLTDGDSTHNSSVPILARSPDTEPNATTDRPSGMPPENAIPNETSQGHVPMVSHLSRIDSSQMTDSWPESGSRSTDRSVDTLVITKDNTTVAPTVHVIGLLRPCDVTLSSLYHTTLLPVVLASSRPRVRVGLHVVPVQSGVQSVTGF